MIRFLRFGWGLALSSAALAVGCGARTDLWGGDTESSTVGESPNAPGAPDDPDDPDNPDAPDEPDEPDFPSPFEPGIKCRDLSFSYSPVPATVLILVDRSGSMEFEFGGDTRWNVVREALFGEPNGLVTELGDAARFGLSFYSSLDGFMGGTCPMMDFSPIVQGDAALLRNTFDATEPLFNGDTPTGEAMDEAIDALLADASPGPRYLVLITDGEPDTCAVPDPQEGQPEALAAAERAFDSGIETYVVGISADIAGRHLQQMSNVAQGVRADAVWGEDPEAVQPIEASTQHEVLADQLQGVLGDVRSCTIPLDPDVDFEGVFEIELDGGTLLSGRDYIVEDERLELLDEACDSVLSDAEELDVTVPCSDD